MTSEADFQRMLDADPSDWQTRLIFSDWLEEQGDRRAAGYRALGLNQLWPYDSTPATGCRPDNLWLRRYPKYEHNNLPDDWFDLLGVRYGYLVWPSYADRMSRNGAEDAAALAFLRLPEYRQQELLQMVTV